MDLLAGRRRGFRWSRARLPRRPAIAQLRRRERMRHPQVAAFRPESDCRGGEVDPGGLCDPVEEFRIRVGWPARLGGPRCPAVRRGRPRTGPLRSRVAAGCGPSDLDRPAPMALTAAKAMLTRSSTWQACSSRQSEPVALMRVSPIQRRWPGAYWRAYRVNRSRRTVISWYWLGISAGRAAVSTAALPVDRATSPDGSRCSWPSCVCPCSSRFTRPGWPSCRSRSPASRRFSSSSTAPRTTLWWTAASRSQPRAW